MNPRQLRTAKRLALLGAAALVLLVYALVVELQGVAQGGQSTISELVWLLWSTHPWVVWLVTVTVLVPALFLAGHWLGQASDKYRQMRGERMSDSTLRRLRREKGE